MSRNPALVYTISVFSEMLESLSGFPKTKTVPGETDHSIDTQTLITIDQKRLGS